MYKFYYNYDFSLENNTNILLPPESEIEI